MEERKENKRFTGRRHTEETRRKMSKNHADISGEKNPFYGKTHTKEAKLKMSKAGKGRIVSEESGRLFDSRGRILIWKPSHPYSNGKGYVFESRLMAEKALGRHLGKNEVVHHINGDIQDNRNVNLLICETGYHHSLHRKMERLRRIK